VRDRMALEQENRELLRQTTGSAQNPASPAGLAWRLDAIEERLAAIENLLRATKSETR